VASPAAHGSAGTGTLVCPFTAAGSAAVVAVPVSCGAGAAVVVAVVSVVDVAAGGVAHVVVGGGAPATSRLFGSVVVGVGAVVGPPAP
jgi:hypothetical protein